MLHFYFSYLVMVLPVVCITYITTFRIYLQFNRNCLRKNTCGLTGVQIAALILEQNDVNNVNTFLVGGYLSDHYNPAARSINLSERVYKRDSISAMGVAAHEAGHAVQHARKNLLLAVCNTLRPVVNITKHVVNPILVIGMVFGSNLFFRVALVFLFAVLLVDLLMYPVEKHASNLAIDTIRKLELIQCKSEMRKLKRVLNAAAGTYFSGVILSLSILVRCMYLTGMI